MKRVSAILGIVAIFAAVMALIICTITGASSETIMALLVCLIILPVLFYGLMLSPDEKARGTKTIRVQNSNFASVHMISFSPVVSMIVRNS